MPMKELPPMTDEQKLSALMAHAKKLQNTTDEMVENTKKNNKNLAENTIKLQKMLNEAIEKLPHAYEKAVLASISDEVRAAIVLSTEKASNALLDACAASTMASKHLRKIWVNGGLILLALAIVITSIAYGIQHVVTLNLKHEAQSYQDIVNTAEKTLENINKKTWGLKLVENKKGKFIVLPNNLTPDTNSSWTVGKNTAIKLNQK